MKPRCCKQAFSVPIKKEEKDTKKGPHALSEHWAFCDCYESEQKTKKGKKKAELFLLHFCATALHRAVSTFGHDDLCATASAEIHFSKLVGHHYPPIMNMRVVRYCARFLVSGKDRLPFSQEGLDAFSSILGRLE